MLKFLVANNNILADNTEHRRTLYDDGPQWDQLDGRRLNTFYCYFDQNIDKGVCVLWYRLK